METCDDDAPPVVLVSMPWTSLTEPSCGLGLLAAVLAERGVASRVFHANLFLLEHLQARTYKAIADIYALNDFVFTGVLDGPVTHAQLRLLRVKARELLGRGHVDVRHVEGVEGLVARLLALRDETVPAWLERTADDVATGAPSLVGFSCMYDQTVASLALARLVRERLPGATIALGGYAVRSPTAEMLVASTPWIDAVCTGEGEQTIVELAEAATGARALADVHGIARRASSGGVVVAAPSERTDLDRLPVPLYDDFFDDVARLSLEHLVDVRPHVLPIENSRGCWWGAKSHCVFCGIRDSDLVFRERDAARTIDAMDTLAARHGLEFFRFSDYILPIRYVDTLLPELARRGAPYRLSGEIKANQTDASFAAMAAAGFVEVQPGIESFSTPVLRRMGKGVSALQNIHTLRLGRRYGLRVYYNLIYGFPDETIADYDAMLAVLSRLLHLDAPVTCLAAQITRYAPLQADPGRFGIGAAHADGSYELVFSDETRRRRGFDLDAYCYYFERTYRNATSLVRSYAQVHRIVEAWAALAASKTAWLYEDEGVDVDGMVVRDRRGADEVVHELSPDDASVLRACEDPVSVARLGDARVLATLDDRGLVFRDGQRVVSLLSVPPERYAPDVLDEVTRRAESAADASPAAP